MKPQLSEVLEEFLEKNSDLKFNTQEAYRRAWNKLIRAIGDKIVFEVNSSHVEDFRSWLFKQGYKPKSVDSAMRNASPIMSWAVYRKYRRVNPFEDVRKPTIPEKEIKVYTDAELYAMLRCANLLWQAKIVTSASAGLRSSEIHNLTWRDINFDEGYITVQAKESTRDTWPWSTKNGKSRQVPLSKQLENLYTALYEKQPDRYPYIMITERRYYNLQKKRQQRTHSST